MRIVYVVEAMGPGGGVRVILEHAEGLKARGHDVSIVTRHAEESWAAWRPIGVPVSKVPAFDRETLPEADVHVATWFPTVVPAVRARRAGRVFHFCQGYEGVHEHLSDRVAEIDEAYEQPIPKLLVSPHLLPVLARFPGARHVIPPALHGEEFRRGMAPKERAASPPVVGVVGPFEIALKGVGVALLARERLRAGGREVRLHRASQMPLSEAETRLSAPDDYRCHVPAGEMPAWYQSLDVLLFASNAIEGLGLPPLEAMAAGTPAVITDIPSLALVPGEAVSRVPVGDDAAMAREAARLLDNAELWRERRRRGLEFAATLTLDRAVDALERAFRDG